MPFKIFFFFSFHTHLLERQSINFSSNNNIDVLKDRQGIITRDAQSIRSK